MKRACLSPIMACTCCYKLIFNCNILSCLCQTRREPISVGLICLPVLQSSSYSWIEALILSTVPIPHTCNLQEVIKKLVGHVWAQITIISVNSHKHQPTGHRDHITAEYIQNRNPLRNQLGFKTMFMSSSESLRKIHKHSGVGLGSHSAGIPPQCAHAVLSNNVLRTSCHAEWSFHIFHTSSCNSMCNHFSLACWEQTVHIETSDIRCHMRHRISPVFTTWNKNKNCYELFGLSMEPCPKLPELSVTSRHQINSNVLSVWSVGTGKCTKSEVSHCITKSPHASSFKGSPEKKKNTGWFQMVRETFSILFTRCS